MKLEIFSTDFQKNTQMSNAMDICPVETELFDADGRTDMTKLMVAFPQLHQRS